MSTKPLKRLALSFGTLPTWKKQSRAVLALLSGCRAMSTRERYELCYRASVQRIKAARVSYADWNDWSTATRALSYAFPLEYAAARNAALARFGDTPTRRFADRQLEHLRHDD